jgi:alkyldihydroxyacetonephosphate synthase
MSVPAVDADLVAKELYALLGPRRVSVSEPDRDTYARDMWPRMLLARREGQPEALRPTAVVWPENVSEVVALVKLALRLRVPIIPYGGGSGVCGGVVPLFGGITIDTKRMQAFKSVNQDDLICDVEAGLGGERFERELARRGYTFGHFPSSIYCSTVGGWVATRAAGQLSTKYGKVEDRVAGLSVVTGRGEVIETDGPNRALRGPNWTQLLVGSEGTLGIITSARLRVSPAPQISIFRGFEVENVAAGIEAIRHVVQLGLRPAVIRLYDELDTLINSFSHHSDEEARESALAEEHLHSHAPTREPGSGALPSWPSPPSGGNGIFDRLKKFASSKTGGIRKDALLTSLQYASTFNRLADTITGKVAKRGCRMIIGFEGSRIRTEVEAALTFSELESVGAKDMGEQPGLSWLAHRYAVSYRMSPMFRDGAFVDTMEVASRWDNLQELYDSVRTAIGKHAVVMAHFSHAYADGCSIYFTFAATSPAGDLRAAERLYDAIWRDGLQAATRVGGTISHHHGVGLLKAPYMEGEHREAMSIYRALKTSLDPAGILNPGKMGLRAVIADPSLKVRSQLPTEAPITMPFDEAKP